MQKASVVNTLSLSIFSLLYHVCLQPEGRQEQEKKQKAGLCLNQPFKEYASLKQ